MGILALSTSLSPPATVDILVEDWRGERRDPTGFKKLVIAWNEGRPLNGRTKIGVQPGNLRF